MSFPRRLVRKRESIEGGSQNQDLFDGFRKHRFQPPRIRRWNDMLSEACFIYKMKDTTNKPPKQKFVF